MATFGKVSAWVLGLASLGGIGFFLFRITEGLLFAKVYVLDTVAAFFLGLVAADFISGVVHWACDTWGDSRLPIIGTYVLKSFRLHHVDQLGITRHDFFEANVLNLLVAVPVLFGASVILLDSRGAVFAVLFLTSLALCSLLTNQVHKWAHQKRTNRFISWLQMKGIILSPVKHKQHHTAPYTDSYCITTGWMNPVLNKLQFFRMLEWVIAKSTGAVPRSDESLYQK